MLDKKNSLYKRTLIHSGIAILGASLLAPSPVRAAPFADFEAGNCKEGDLVDDNGVTVQPNPLNAITFDVYRSIANVVTLVNWLSPDPQGGEVAVREAIQGLVGTIHAVMYPSRVAGQPSSIHSCAARGTNQALHDSIADLSRRVSPGDCDAFAQRIGTLKAEVYCAYFERDPESIQVASRLKSSRSYCEKAVSSRCNEEFLRAVKERCAEFSTQSFAKVVTEAQAFACEEFQGAQGSILVRVLDEAGNPARNLSFRLGSETITLDAQGQAVHPMAEGVHVLRLDVPEFAAATREVRIAGDQSTDVLLRVIRRQKALTLDAGAGQTLSTPSVQLQFPAGALVDESGNTYTGNAQVQITPLDVQRHIDLAPGPFRALTEEGARVQLESFGMMEAKLRDAQGNPLQVAEGKSVGMSMKVQGGDYKEGDTIPLWWLDPQEGIWKEEGQCVVGVKNGELWCSGQASHFTWWNLDKEMETSCVRGIVRDCNGQVVTGAALHAKGINYLGTSQARSCDGGEFCALAMRDQRIELTALSLGTEGVLGARQWVRTPATASSCDSQRTRCSYVELDLPCTPEESGYDCTDVTLGSCSGCISGRVELDPGYSVEGVDVVVYPSWWDLKRASELSRAPLRPDGSYCMSAGSAGDKVTVTVQSSQFAPKLVTARRIELGAGRCPNCTPVETIAVGPTPQWASCAPGVSATLSATTKTAGFPDGFAGLANAGGHVAVPSGALAEESWGDDAEFVLYLSDAKAPIHSLGVSNLALRGGLNADGSVGVGEHVFVRGSHPQSIGYYHPPGAGTVLGYPGARIRVEPSSELRWTRNENTVRLSGTVNLKVQTGQDRSARATYQLGAVLPAIDTSSLRAASCGGMGVSDEGYQEGELRFVRINGVRMNVRSSRIEDDTHVPWIPDDELSPTTTIVAELEDPSSSSGLGELYLRRRDNRLFGGSYSVPGCSYFDREPGPEVPNYPGSDKRWSAQAEITLAKHSGSSCVGRSPEVRIEAGFDIAATEGFRRLCFVPGTPVQTPEGQKPIEDLVAGDKVRCWEEDTAKWDICTVKATHARNHSGRIHSIGVDGQTIQATSEHPFWVTHRNSDEVKPASSGAFSGTPSGQWIPVRDLRVGDRVLLSNGQERPIQTLAHRRTQTMVHNISVNDHQTYAVGELGVLVHNK